MWLPQRPRWSLVVPFLVQSRLAPLVACSCAEVTESPAATSTASLAESSGLRHSRSSSLSLGESTTAPGAPGALEGVGGQGSGEPVGVGVGGGDDGGGDE